MTLDEKLGILKNLIDEQTYPTYTDDELINLIEGEDDILLLAKTLLIKKAAIPDIKLGDIEIKSPRAHYTMLLSQLRRKTYDADGNIINRPGTFRVMVRADGQS